MESVIKNALRVTIVSKEIERADRIECFFVYIEVELLSWLIVKLQSRKGKVLWFGCW